MEDPKTITERLAELINELEPLKKERARMVERIAKGAYATPQERERARVIVPRIHELTREIKGLKAVIMPGRAQ